MKKIVLIFCLFSSWVSFSQEETTSASLDTIQSSLNEIANGYLATIYSHSFETQNYLYSLSEKFDTLNLTVVDQYNLLQSFFNEIYLTISDSYSKLTNINDNFDIFNTNFDTYSENVRQKLLEITDGYLATIYSKMFSIDDNLESILQEIEGNEERENLNSQNIQAIRDQLESYYPEQWERLISSVQNIENNTEYGDISYDNQDLIDYFTGINFGTFYGSFHGFGTSSFYPSYIGFQRWTDEKITPLDSNLNNAFKPTQGFDKNNFFSMIAIYLDELALMGANSQKTEMMIFNLLNEQNENHDDEKQFIENKVAELQAEESRLRAAFEKIEQLQENINFEKFEEYLKFDGSGKVDISMILSAGQWYDEIDLGFFPSEWNNRPINIGNLYVNLSGYRDVIMTCRDIFKIVYLLIITFFILWIVNRFLPVLVRLFTTLKAILIWK